MNNLTTTPDITTAIEFTAAVCKFDPAIYIEQAEQYVAKYRNLEVSENDVPEINLIIKDLNKQSKLIDEQRKKIKREFNTPLALLEDNVKSIIAVYTGTVEYLKGKTEEYEKKYRDEKTVLIGEYIAKSVTEARLNLKFSSRITILEEYYNKTATPAKIKKSLAERCILEFQNQENERLADELKAEREQARQKLLVELNANYKGRMHCEITHVRTHHLSDEELFEFFKFMEKKFNEEQNELKEAAEAEERRLMTKQALEAQLFDPRGPIIVSSPRFEPEIRKEIEEAKHEPSTHNVEPSLSSPSITRYIVDLSCGEDDTILPWLEEMKKYGINVNIVRKV